MTSPHQASGHTPGPWKAATAGSSIVGIPVVGPKGRAIASLHFSPEGVPGREPYNAEQLANAQLIAAAPDMLAALKKIVSEGDFTAPEGMKRIALDAIAKAEGK